MAPSTHSTGSTSVWSDEQLQEVAQKLYTPIRTWQTRIIRLQPGQPSDILKADLLVAGLIQDDGLVLGMDEEPVAFEAISYSWGAPDACVDIVIDGLEYRIHQSLADALRRFRYDRHERYLWADALCINQVDLAEKSQQVQNMFRIYRKAKSVLVWLGSETADLASALEVLYEEAIGIAEATEDDRSETSTSASSADTGPVSQFETVIPSAEPNTALLAREINALHDLCTRAWIRRVWVQQEIFAATDVRVFCGRSELDLDRLKRAAAVLSSKVEDRGTSDWPSQPELEIARRLVILIFTNSKADET
ncbi:hypothetical protein LTR36_000777 [Oleoguttula mirabilis]|uniref:Heterokaryon incompatibility domain-containing protein n=1 Tax=Oleoguttula mirabilis TaxID=1507867 RepID=A0AAV9J3J4_9PEZI|nr:hypothetical protein LTR36_000777 [Oleoguttula mirabilis]